MGLHAYLKRKFNEQRRISYERVVSGTGLVNVYEYLAVTFPELVDSEIQAKIEAAGDLKGAVIATNQQNEICAKTMELFVSAYGTAAGAAALTWLPFGGLFITGGMTPKNMNLLKDPKGPFYTSFADKGRLSGYIKNIPLYLVKVEDLGERGAQFVAAKLLFGVDEKNDDETMTVSILSEKYIPKLNLVSLAAGIVIGTVTGVALFHLKKKK